MNVPYEVKAGEVSDIPVRMTFGGRDRVTIRGVQLRHVRLTEDGRAHVFERCDTPAVCAVSWRNRHKLSGCRTTTYTPSWLRRFVVRAGWVVGLVLGLVLGVGSVRAMPVSGYGYARAEGGWPQYEIFNRDDIFVYHEWAALGNLSEWQYKTICIELGRRGYRSSEPDGISRETSGVWKMILEQLWNEKVTKSDIAKQLCLPVDEIEGLIWNLAAVNERPPVDGTRGLRAIN